MWDKMVIEKWIHGKHKINHGHFSFENVYFRVMRQLQDKKNTTLYPNVFQWKESKTCQPQLYYEMLLDPQICPCTSLQLH